MELVAVEIMASLGHDPSELYAELTSELGAPVIGRVDAPSSAEEKAVLLDLSPADVGSELAANP
jgi:phosphoglucomutase